jgi:hypothetical protein
VDEKQRVLPRISARLDELLVFEPTRCGFCIQVFGLWDDFDGPFAPRLLCMREAQLVGAFGIYLFPESALIAVLAVQSTIVNVAIGNDKHYSLHLLKK